MEKKVAKERMLIPPNWISIRITTCPLKVKQADVLTTESPVIQLALVAVKSASIKEIPLVVMRGIISRIVPMDMRKRNDPTINMGGLRWYFPKVLLIFAISTRTMIKK